MTPQRAYEIHDKAWADYMKAFHRSRAKWGRGSFKAKQAFLDASDRVARAHDYVRSANAKAGL